MRRMMFFMLLSMVLAGCISSEHEVLSSEQSSLLAGVESGVYFSFVEGEKGEEIQVIQSSEANEYIVPDEQGEPGTIIRFLSLASDIYLVQMTEVGRIDLFVVHYRGDGIFGVIPWDKEKCVGALEACGLSVSDTTIQDNDLENIREGLLAWSNAAKGDLVEFFYLSEREYGGRTEEELRELLRDRQAWPGGL